MIQYKNLNGKLISEQQVGLLKEYAIHTTDDQTGLLKKVETIKLKRGDQRYKFFEYYLDSGENKSGIIQQYTNEVNDYRLGIYSNLQTAFNFKMWDFENYSNTGVLIAKSKVVFDTQNRLILKVYFDIQTDEIKKFPLPIKYYYASSEDAVNGLADLELMFTYEFNENINQFVTYIKDLNETTGEIHTKNVDGFIELMGLDFWNKHPYYHALQPLLPTSLII
ncbi:hypothetical protein DRF59_05850 [Chryseobacterium flavum]|uniref:Uncharacterized protein n=1 Tax=Chryseobacterium flavum TaxID=415851 RepID=A0A3D9CQ19_9FLAO|nr:hypothetical protein [Chryseobacterium flavum]REC67854.1 hypothetical protein DRF59_05850 [Chryseobacterium flavum]